MSDSTAAAPANVRLKVEDIHPLDLKLDRHNPRMPGRLFPDETGALAYLARYGALDEIISSIEASGWIDFEPLIVLRHDDALGESNIVIEGNRRVAALKLLADPDLARELRVSVPDNSRSLVPASARAWVVKSRAEARGFIGFKHINGPYRWDSFAKAKFASDWVRETSDIESVSKQLGDSHSTVLRLVNGYKVYRQAEDEGFTGNIGEGGKFSFSHLYVGLTRPGIRNFVGIESSSELLSDSPVASDKLDNLNELIGWLYGNERARAVIKSQNPDIKWLSAVLEEPRSVAMLRDRQDLRMAYDLIENKSELFSREVDRLWTASKVGLSLIAHYQGDKDLLERVQEAGASVRGLVAAMTEVHAELGKAPQV